MEINCSKCTELKHQLSIQITNNNDLQESVERQTEEIATLEARLEAYQADLKAAQKKVIELM